MLCQFLQRSPFFSFGRGFVTVLTMVTGELDYQDVFSLSYELNANDSDVYVQQFPYSIPEHTANFVWVVFLVFVPILLTNMLVSSCT